MRTPACRRSRACFNGAATLSLRKLGGDAVVVQTGERASMGPQLYRCGNQGWSQDVQGCDLASMGPQLYRCGNMGTARAPFGSLVCFNGAATLSLRKPRRLEYVGSSKDMLQWGRNFIVAETRQEDADHLKQVHASMGPQLYRCGNYYCESILEQLRNASMGPQLYRCGNYYCESILEQLRNASMGPQLYRCGNEHYQRC